MARRPRPKAMTRAQHWAVWILVALDAALVAAGYAYLGR
jgi:hypothetical protein